MLAISVIAVAVIAFAFLDRFREEQDRPGQLALSVEESRISLGYYVDRLNMLLGGNTSISPEVALGRVTDTIIEEEMVLAFGPELGVSVTPEEIDAELKDRLGLNEFASDDDGERADRDAPAGPEVEAAATALASAIAGGDVFLEAYRSELKSTGLSDEEYRRMLQAQLLISRIRDTFSAQVPLAAESVRYRLILAKDNATADEIIARVGAGEDFAALAVQQSQDSRTKAAGGDAGWAAKGALTQDLEVLLFSLQVGRLEKLPSSNGIFIYQVLEKAESREIEENQRKAVASRSYQTWLDGKRQSVQITNDLDLVDGDAGKLQWVVRKVYG